ncbi:lipase family protein [Nocardia asteroides]|uniref:lipase family protein n=1 Tax=Nocardia asteroides TaxID=1824 RepID=UPI001E4C9B52|nr:lipase family protein [Nocardia asteroides]UGT54376.1 lipase family protein [Nocardia asteroides]
MTLYTGWAVAVPPPEQDSFYAEPAGLANLADGTVLASRVIEPVSFGSPLPADAWQVQYKTIDNHGEPRAYVATVLVPHGEWSGAGQRPLLSYQVAEDGAGATCAPSYALRGGINGVPSNAYSETGMIRFALQQGWALVVADYQGPDSDLFGAEGYVHGVLDGIRAARAFEPAAIDPAAPIGMWGYSGGAQATAVAAQSQAVYAPELPLAGVALGGTVADLESTMSGFSGGVLGGAAVIGLVGLNRSYPDADVAQYLNESGRAKLAASQNDCLLDAALKYPFLDAAELEAWPGSITNNPALSEVVRGASPLFRPGAPTVPVLIHHAIADEFAPIDSARALAGKYCAAGTPVQRVENPIGEHGTEAMLGLPAVLSYLADRFSAKPAPNDC